MSKEEVTTAANPNSGEGLNVESLRKAIREMPPAPKYLTVGGLKDLLNGYNDQDTVVIAEGRFMVMKTPPALGIPEGFIALSEPIMEEHGAPKA